MQSKGIIELHSCASRRAGMVALGIGDSASVAPDERGLPQEVDVM